MIEVGIKGSAVWDLILTNQDEMIQDIKVVGTLGASNHAFLQFLILIKKSFIKNKLQPWILERQILMK